MKTANMKKSEVLLATAVLMAISKKFNEKKPFSAWEITTAIRESCNTGSLIVTDVSTSSLLSLSCRFVIEHVRVNEIINQFFPFLPVTRNFNGGYYVYTPKSEIQLDGKMNTKLEGKKQVKKPSTTRVIVDYINRKLAKSELPTLKSVQSRLKGTSLTTKQIEKLCLDKGYNVSRQDGLKPSLSIIYA